MVPTYVLTPPNTNLTANGLIKEFADGGQEPER
jgi:hypothetical protein